MAHILHSTISQAGAVLVAFIVGGCSSLRPASSVDYVSPEFSPEEVGSICVLPVTDSRADKSIVANLDSRVREPVEDELKSMGYTLISPDSSNANDTVTPHDLTFPTPERIVRIGPKEARWVMVIELEKTDCTNTVWKDCGSAGISLSCHLFDKSKRCLVLKRQVHCQVFNKGFWLFKLFESDAHFVPYKDAAKCASSCLPVRAQP